MELSANSKSAGWFFEQRPFLGKPLQVDFEPVFLTILKDA